MQVATPQAHVQLGGAPGAGEIWTAELTPVDVNGKVLASKLHAKAFALGGSATAGDTWTLTLTDASDGTELGTVTFVASGNTLEDVAQGLAQAGVVGTGASEFELSFSGAHIAVARASSTDFEIALSSPAGSVGTPTLDGLAAALSDVIDADARYGAAADAGDASAFTIVGTEAFFTDFEIVPDTRGAATVDKTTEDGVAVVTVDLSGTPAIREVWQLVIDGNTFAHEVRFGEDLAAIAQALRDTAEDADAGAPYDVQVVGRAISVRRNDGGDRPRGTVRSI